MSNRSKIIFAIISSLVLVVFLIALAAVGGYALGRGSIADEEQQAVESAPEIEPTKLPVATEPADSSEIVAAESDLGEESDSAEAVEEVEEVEDAEPTDEPEVTSQEPIAEESTEAPDIDRKDMDLFIEVWELIGDSFDGQFPAEEEVIYSAIGGSLEILDDDNTRFIPEHVAQQLRLQLDGSFEGIGAYVELNEDGYLVIVRPMEDQPADRAGIKSGDLITHVDGESILGKSLDEIIAAVKGPKGTEVTLTISRESESEPFDIVVVRDLIEIPVVMSEMLEENVGYIRLSSFNGIATERVDEAIDELLESNPEGLIFDLRDNPGGLLSQAVSVADLFLADGIILYERNSVGEEDIFRADDGEGGESIPLVVLINGGSASASEIVAGALQYHDRAVLVGDQSFGKGSVQRSHTLSDGSELRVTIARWYTPANISIDENGVTPDIAVETPEEFFTEEDTQLQRAIDLLLNGE